MNSSSLDIVQRHGGRGTLPIDEKSSQAKREVFFDERSLLPEIPMIGRIYYDQALPELPEHSHQESFEICYLRTGSLDWEVGSKRYELHQGDLFITIPGEFHGGTFAMMQPCELDFIQLHQGMLRRIKEPTGAMTLKLLKEIKFLSQRKFQGSLRIAACFDAILEEHRRRDPRSVTQSRLWIALLLGEIIRLQETPRIDKPKVPSAITFKIQKVLRYLDQHWMESPTLGQLEKVIGLDESQLQRRFKKEIGCNLHDYVITKKMAEAKKRLLDPKISITVTALDLGFSSSQYFSTVFKKYYGLSPSDFKNKSLLNL